MMHSGKGNPFKKKRISFHLIIFTFTVVLIFFVIYSKNIINNEKRFYKLSYKQLRESLGINYDGSNQTGCNIPLHLDPWDPSITPYIKTLEKKISCSRKLSYFSSKSKYYQIGPLKMPLTFVNDHGVITFTQKFSKLQCYYEPFTRNGSDIKVTYQKPKLLSQETGLNMESSKIMFTKVFCKKDDDTVYKNAHFWPADLKPNVQFNSTSIRPSVIILVIESLSRLNFLRFMKETQAEIKSLNAEYLDGLTKLGDNSAPNMIPLLTGYRLYKHEIPGLNAPENGPFDKVPFIWKEFKKSGYLTSLIEDHPPFSLFNYMAKGFEKRPTDWYPRPFWIHMYNDVPDVKWDYCYFFKPKVEIWLDQTRYFIKKSLQLSTPIFNFAFYTQVTHDEFNRAQNLDTHLANFIREHKSYLKDSIFILMGDHGNRYGPILETVIGRIEERMPFFSISLPSNLTTKYPHLRKNLQDNKNKLVTWIDVHNLLLDVAHSSYGELNQSAHNEYFRGYSPWRESISINRTCKEALIPDNYCVCDDRREIDIQNELVQESALALIENINSKLNSELCQILTLKEVHSASVIFPSDTVIRVKGFQLKLDLVIKANPSNATFSSLLAKVANSDKWNVIGDISRINSYGNQSSCIEDHILEKFCYCYF